MSSIKINFIEAKLDLVWYVLVLQWIAELLLNLANASINKWNRPLIHLKLHCCCWRGWKKFQFSLHLTWLKGLLSTIIELTFKRSMHFCTREMKLLKCCWLTLNLKRNSTKRHMQLDSSVFPKLEIFLNVQIISWFFFWVSIRKDSNLQT